MSLRQWLVIIVLILLPINAWLGVFYYLNKQRREAAQPSIKLYRESIALRVTHFQEKWGIKEGKRLVYPFPAFKKPTALFGAPPPIRQGHPVLFINIAWIFEPEVWEPTIQEALKASPFLHVVLLFYPTHPEDTQKQLTAMLQHFRHHPRLSILGGEWVHTVFGGQFGILAFLCDGNGIVRAVEPYPKLKFVADWEEEVTDWRPKLHQAVKKVLDKFFPKRSR